MSRGPWKKPVANPKLAAYQRKRRKKIRIQERKEVAELLQIIKRSMKQWGENA